MTHNTYIHQCTDYRQQLQDNEQELKVMEVKEENSKVAESMQAIKVCTSLIVLHAVKCAV